MPNYTAFDWSKTSPNIVAVGGQAGEANIISIDPDQSNSNPTPSNSLSTSGSQPPNQYIWSFPIKSQRKCNSIAFSTKNFLATGLERVRNDYSMNIYNVDAERSWKDNDTPIRYAYGETITSIKFFNNTPDTLIAGVSKLSLRLYDLRESQVHVAANFATRHVHNIAIDPLDENYFVSAGPTGEPTVSVWDKRFAARGPSTPLEGPSNGPVLEIRNAVDNTQSSAIWGLRFSGTSKGCFGVLSSTGELRVLDLAQHSSKSVGSSQTLSVSTAGSTYWGSSRHYVRRSHSLRSPWYEDEWREQESQRIIAYDFVNSSDGNANRGLSIVGLHPNRDIELLSVPGSSALINLTAMNELAVIDKKSRYWSSGKTALTVAEENLEIQRNLARERQQSIEQTRNLPAEQRSEHVESPLQREPASRSNIIDALRDQSVHRRRCLEGYMLDSQLNQNIVADSPQLTELWRLIERFENIAYSSDMREKPLNLSFVGVYNIWNMTLGVHRNRTQSSRTVSAEEFVDTVVSITEGSGYPGYRGARTSRPAQRQLCLALCGWSFSKFEMQRRCERMIEDGQVYKAIVTAVMHGFKDVSLEFLRMAVQRRSMQNIGLGAVIACETINHEQREMCAWMLDEAEDPYLKALLAFFIHGDWIRVADMPLLSLSDRVGIALKHFDDQKLSIFLHTTLQRAIKAGDPEAILLTGLTQTALDVFQQYIANTSDLQTAVLAMSLTCPLYLPSDRFSAWHETYLMQMQSWRCFAQRDAYMQAHAAQSIAHASKTHHTLSNSTSRMLNQPALACNYCHKSLGYTRITSGPPDSDSIIHTPTPPKLFSRSAAAQSGLVCPRCNSRMPACGICGVLVGQPDPKKVKPGAEVKLAEDEGEELTMYCFSCQHCFHAGEGREWFARHRVCPVPECTCLCGLLH